MAVAIFDNVDLPLVFSQQVGREVLADRARTAGGRMRQDVVAVKRTWRLETRPALKVQTDLLLTTLEADLFAPKEFWLEEFGSTNQTVTAFVTDIREERDIQAPERRSLSITVEEQ